MAKNAKKELKNSKKNPKKMAENRGGGIPSGLLYYWIGYGHGGWPWWPGKKKIGGGFLKKNRGDFFKN